MPLKEKKRVMTAGDMERALRRMSSEILERNRGCDNLIVIGIQRRYLRRRGCALWKIPRRRRALF